MPVLVNIGLLATCREEGGQDAIHAVPEAALAWRGGEITCVGPANALPNEYRDDERIDAERRLVVPGLIDCHTHLAFAGWRADEIDARMRAHMAFLNKHYAEGRFLISGRKIPRDGGIILALGKSRDEIETLMREDPFCKHGLAEFRVIEFRASQRADPT